MLDTGTPPPLLGLVKANFLSNRGSVCWEFPTFRICTSVFKNLRHVDATLLALGGLPRTTCWGRLGAMRCSPELSDLPSARRSCAWLSSSRRPSRQPSPSLTSAGRAQPVVLFGPGWASAFRTQTPPTQPMTWTTWGRTAFARQTSTWRRPSSTCARCSEYEP